jgi:transcriptional regulator with XRE-family HTH domain
MPANRRAIRPGQLCPRRRRAAHVDASGFKDARLIAGLTRQAAADLLGVTERTVRNWEAKRARVPYSAFKLMRILSGYELPGAAWRGFRLSKDVLWSPEGRAFAATDLSWWGLTVALARSFRLQHARASLLPCKPGVTHVLTQSPRVSSGQPARPVGLVVGASLPLAPEGAERAASRAAAAACSARLDLKVSTT